MKITRTGTSPSHKGPEDWFTGPVRVDPNLTGKVVGWVEMVTDGQLNNR